MTRVLLYVLAVCSAGICHADSHQPVKNLVSISVDAAEDVDNDLLVVRLFAQHEARRQAEASDRVNEDMAWALSAAGKHAAVEAQTLDYRTDPVYKDRTVQGWRTRQSLKLESADRKALTGLMGVLQERLAIESVSYEVSDELRGAAEERLIAEAIRRFMARAERVAAAFGRSAWSLVSVNVGAHGGRPPPVPFAGRALAAQAEGAGPSIEAGVQSVEVSVSGTIELSP